MTNWRATMSIIEQSECDFCHTSFSAPIYFPKNTRRAMQVYVCENCGLIQSSQGVPEPERIQTLSTDADWGNVRHGKGVRFEFLRTILETEIHWEGISRVADVGSNRGDFVLWLNNNHPKVECWAIEPDKSVVENYAHIQQVNLHLDRLENVPLPNDYFDLIFCSHTLEHADTAAEMIEIIRKALRPGGMLLLEVPNLQGITGQDVIEEFFIDKHTFHFDRETLIDYVTSSGFSVLRGLNDNDELNITLLLCRDAESVVYHPIAGISRATRNFEWINLFANRMPINRQLLKWIVQEKLRPLGARQKVGYWGGGRILDTLLKYGGLRPDDIFCLVDSHLHKIVKETNGIRIERPEMLRILEPQVLVTLGRSSENLMAKSAYSFGIRHVVMFSELMGQARNASDLRSAK